MCYMTVISVGGKVISTAGPIVICGLHSHLKESLISSEVGESRDEFPFLPSPNSFIDTPMLRKLALRTL